jgi:leader peptidase (prepilin peptidase)/N-methyltransferase
MRLPKVLTLVIALSAAGLAYCRHSLPEAILSALVIGGLFLGLHRLKTRSGVAPIGVGDVKLAAALALWLGPASGWMIGVAALAGLIFVWTRRQRPERLAFGTALAFGAMVVGFTLEVMSWRAQV